MLLQSQKDHFIIILIVDIEDCKQDIKLGDIIDFHMFYQPMVYLSSSTSITKVYI